MIKGDPFYALGKDVDGLPFKLLIDLPHCKGEDVILYQMKEVLLLLTFLVLAHSHPAEPQLIKGIKGSKTGKTTNKLIRVEFESNENDTNGFLCEVFGKIGYVTKAVLIVKNEKNEIVLSSQMIVRRVAHENSEYVYNFFINKDSGIKTEILFYTEDGIPQLLPLNTLLN